MSVFATCGTFINVPKYNAQRGGRTHDAEIKSLVLYRLS